MKASSGLLSAADAGHDDRPSATAGPTGMSLEWKLPLLMTGLLAAGLAASLAISYWTLADQAEATLRERLASAAAEVATATEAALRASAARVQEVADDGAVRRALREPESVTSDSSWSRALARLSRDRETALPVEIWDREGRVVAHVGAPVASTERPTSFVADSVVYTPMYAADTAVRFWALAPVMLDGRRIGVVASLRTVGGRRGATRTLRGLTGEPVSLFTRNADGTFWTEAPGVRAGLPYGRDTTARGLRYRRPGVGSVMAFERRIGGTPYVSVLEVPSASVLERARRTTTRLGLLSLLLLAVGAVASWALSRRITRPIVALGDAAARVAVGTYEHAIPRAGKDEIGRLAASFDVMARKVTSTRQELERRVAETLATADRLEATNEQLREAMGEADRARTDADRAREEAERANRAKSDFLAVMSHELRTPLNAIAGYVQLIEMGLRGPVTEEQRRDLERIKHSQRLLLALINDVLNFAKLEAGRVEYHIEALPVAALLTPVAEVIAPQVASKRIAFTVRGGDGLAVLADAEKTRQVLLNLLVNAVRHTPPEGRIELRAEPSGERVLLHVEDSGDGIPASQQDRIFEPFVQLGRSLRAAADGTGLGLAISRDLARGMAGELSVRSEVGVGSIFTLALPVVGSRTVAPDEALQSPSVIRAIH